MNQPEVFASNPVNGCLYRVRHLDLTPFLAAAHEAVLVKLANEKPVCYLGNGKYLIAGSGEQVCCPNLVVFEPGVVGRHNLRNPDLIVWLETMEFEED